MGTDLELSPFAAKSLRERMITRILEREDEGHLRWTPLGIYEQVVHLHPELYPPEVSQTLLVQFSSEEFMADLEQRRFQRLISQLPGRMVADKLGRRIIDLVAPLIFTKLAEANANVSILDPREARMLLKDALTYVMQNEAAMFGGKVGKDDEDKAKHGISLEDAKVLLAHVSPERQQDMAMGIAHMLLSQVREEAEKPIDVEAIEG